MPQDLKQQTTPVHYVDSKGSEAQNVGVACLRASARAISPLQGGPASGLVDMIVGRSPFVPSYPLFLTLSFSVNCPSSSYCDLSIPGEGKSLPRMGAVDLSSLIGPLAFPLCLLLVRPARLMRRRGLYKSDVRDHCWLPLSGRCFLSFAVEA